MRGRQNFFWTRPSHPPQCENLGPF
jgi:hypothetical protein